MKKFKVGFVMVALVLSIFLFGSFTSSYASPNEDDNGEVETGAEC